MEMARQHIAALGRGFLLGKIKLYTGEIRCSPLPDRKSQIESAFQREVRYLGGSIVIDSTEALAAIDIAPARATRDGGIRKPR